MVDCAVFPTSVTGAAKTLAGKRIVTNKQILIIFWKNLKFITD
jgi:hypothetical protein